MTHPGSAMVTTSYDHHPAVIAIRCECHPAVAITSSSPIAPRQWRGTVPLSAWGARGTGGSAVRARQRGALKCGRWGRGEGRHLPWHGARGGGAARAQGGLPAAGRRAVLHAACAWRKERGRVCHV
eukprot:332431-Pelagomonas_calceolata.AAC.2